MPNWIRRDGKRFPVEFTLAELEDILNPKLFYHANRQYIVHATSIRRIFPYFNGRLLLGLEPAAKKDVLVSKEKARALKKVDWALAP